MAVEKVLSGYVHDLCEHIPEVYSIDHLHVQVQISIYRNCVS